MRLPPIIDPLPQIVQVLVAINHQKTYYVYHILLMDAIDIFFQIAILVMSVVIHEVSHGVAAYVQGDKTAKYAGRLTLNPLPHIDPIGSIALPLLLAVTGSPFMIGWAKPVPYNPYNLRNQKWGSAIVGIAGPLSNILLAISFGFVFRFGGDLLPLAFLHICLTIAILNVVLAVFNMVPIPPLDGSKVLFSFFPYYWHRYEAILEQYGFILLLMFIFFLSPVVSTVSGFIIKLIIGI